VPWSREPVRSGGVSRQLAAQHVTRTIIDLLQYRVTCDTDEHTRDAAC
jgi:hypothetical protein